MAPTNVLFWHKDYFELSANDKKQVQYSPAMRPQVEVKIENSTKPCVHSFIPSDKAGQRMNHVPAMSVQDDTRFHQITQNSAEPKTF